MKAPEIPTGNTDLIAVVRQRDRRFLLKWLITTAILTAFAVAFFKPAANFYGVPIAILLALGFVVLPFILCGGIEWISDRGFTGTVEDLDFSVRLETHDTMGVVTTKGISKKRIKHASAVQVNYCRITVLTDEGKGKTCTVRLPGDSGSFPLHKGDRIVKYRGLPFPVVLGCKTPLCAVCGHPDDDGKGECRLCGGSLIVLPRD